MILKYPINGIVLGLKGQRSRLRLCLGYSNTAWVRTLRVPYSLTCNQKLAGNQLSTAGTELKGLMGKTKKETIEQKV